MLKCNINTTFTHVKAKGSIRDITADIGLLLCAIKSSLNKEQGPLFIALCKTLFDESTSPLYTQMKGE